MNLSTSIETLQKALKRIDHGSGTASFTSTEHDRLMRALALLSTKASAAPELAEALRALIDDSWSDISNQPCVPSKSTVIAARAVVARVGA